MGKLPLQFCPSPPHVHGVFDGAKAVLSMSRPMGRLPFLIAISGMNIVILLTVLFGLAFRPTGGGHLAVLIVVGGLQYVWMTLHARRFLDAGHGPAVPIMAFLLCFAAFAAGYLFLAALWASPEVQREAFRTAGGITGSGAIVGHEETIQFLVDGGRIIAASFGVAGAVVLSGFILLGFGIIAVVSGCFSIIAAALPSGRAVRSGDIPQSSAVKMSL
jgi:hypothetical protein